MRFYRLRPEGMRKEYIKILPQVSGMLLLAIVIAFVVTGNGIIRRMGTNGGLILLGIVFFIFALTTLSYQYSRLRMMWKSFLIILEGDVLIWRIQGTSETHMSLADIDEIIEDKSRGIIIKDILKKRIFIPDSLADYEDFKAELFDRIPKARITMKRIIFNDWFTRFLNR